MDADSSYENTTPVVDDTNGAPDTVLDGATPVLTRLPGELTALKDIATDQGRAVEERLEAFEDILDSEVGDTTLTRARNVEREVGLRQLYLKFEGGNPTGTQKDRIAFAQAMDALRRGFDAITVATCGNYGAAVAMAASFAGLRCYIYIPEGYRTKRIDEMTSQGAEIVRCAGDYEKAVQLSGEQARADEIYDANPGGANTALQLRAYGEIAYEIYDELRDAPAAVALPVSNGTTLAGVYRGFISLHRRGKTSRLPRMIAGSTFGKNPIIHAFRGNRANCEDLRPDRLRETAVNEPLINWHAIDGDLALEAVRASGGHAGYASDKSMSQYARILREKEGLSVLPASTAGMIALLERHRQEPLPGDRYVVVVTGKKA
ncbi:MAG: pyridoxal-phosphate dependent enzyme [Planctomycetes bacterium]|nr:pyridoxal-phosphate dependent enzyme [Planctomycetota bacterium]